MLFILEVLLALSVMMTILVTMVWSVLLLIRIVLYKSEDKKNKIRKRLHKVMIIMDITMFFVTLDLIRGDIARSFYCISEDKCITLWKRNGYCYIIPGKYYGIFSPKDNYVKTDNLVESSDIIWTDDDRLVIAINPRYESKFVSQFSDKGLPMIENYYANKAINDSVYLYFSGRYNTYKKEVNFICLYIKGNYAMY